MYKGHRIAALCTARMHDEDSNKFIAKLNDVLVSRDYRLLIYGTVSDLLKRSPGDMAQRAIFELIPYEIVDLVIIMEEKINDKEVVDEIIERSRSHNKPIVTVGAAYEGCGNIQFAYEYGFEKVVRHMVVEHGILDLHLIAGMPDNRFSDDRIEVFRKVLEENGGTFRPEMVSYGYFWSDPTREAVEKMIEEKRVPRGIVCCNDIMAMTACSTLKRFGYEVPRDVLVTGFDGLDDIQYSEPPITSCQCRFEDLAEKLGIYLDEGVEEMPKMRKKVAPYLIRSESCGCLMGMHANASVRLSEMSNRLFLYQEDEYMLTEIMATMASADTLQSAADSMQGHYQLHEMSCMLRKEIIDETINPMELSLTQDTFGEDLFVFYHFKKNELNREQFFMPKSQIVPDFDTLVERKYPLIFNIINFLQIPMGYVCFHFEGLDMIRFVKIPQVVNAISNALGSLRNVRYQTHLIQRIEDMYKTDALTDLFNRNSFFQIFAREREKIRSEGSNPTVTMIFADVDGLKKINDVYGHSEGDITIRTTAHALRYSCPENAICVRFGGDEMIAVVFDECREEDVRLRFEEYLRRTNEELKKPYQISASIGFFKTTVAGEVDFEAMLKEADALMYQEKRAKRTQV